MREKIISIAFLLAIVLVAGCIEKEVQSLQGEPLQKTAGSVHGTVIGARNATLENARVTLISLNGSANYSAITGKNGKFNITDVPDGAYGVAVQKEGYRNNAPSPFLIFSGYSYDLNISLVRDCFYYSVNTTTDYAVRYGYNGTIYRGDITFIVPYPDGAAYSISPDAKNGLSGTDTIYKAGNRMLEWTLNNSKGGYQSVQGYIYMDMNGTQEMRLFDAKGTGIADAAAAQPGYLGSEINGDTDKRAMIDPSNSEIKAIAGKIRDETESEDAQAVAKALFIWMKNNTAYHVSKENPNYTQSAIEVLHSRQGDCDELSFLYISLCRAAGIPARFVEGFWAGKKFDGEYVGHVWAEFYDGQWTPVELATVWGKPDSSAAVGDGSFDFNSYVIENDLAINFGVSQPDHVATFVDGGTSESITRGNGGLSNSYGKRPSFSPYTWYGAESYDSKYIVSCADGTRALSDEMD